eukprot:s563_g7.t1
MNLGCFQLFRYQGADLSYDIRSNSQVISLSCSSMTSWIQSSAFANDSEISNREVDICAGKICFEGRPW